MRLFFYVSILLMWGCGSLKKTNSVDGMSSGESSNWKNYANSKASTKYSSLTQITKKNINKVGVIWRWRSPDQDILEAHPKLFTMYNESTPLAIDGFLYVSTSLSQVAKIDGATGKTIWVFDPKSYRDSTPPNMGFVNRGLSYWESPDKTERRIFLGTGNGYLIAIDPDSGQSITSFGTAGRIDLLKGLQENGSDWPDNLRWHYSVTSPGVICKDTLIIGSSILDEVKQKKTASGAVRAFDVRSGKLVWRFNPNSKDGNSNVWSLMSVDEARGLAFLPIGAPANDWFGGERPGPNLFSNSLVCLECLSGKLKWHYQTTHHDVWDYDLPAAPNLVEIPWNGKMIPAVAQVTKQSYLFILNRLTGQPLWPIIEKAAPPSALEKLSTTQPHPTWPKAFDRQGITSEDLIDFTPSLKLETEKVVAQYDVGPLYTPATHKKKGTLLLPGINGGANWSGASYLSEKNLLFITSIADPWVGYLEKQPAKADGQRPDYRYLRTFKRSFVTDPDGQRRKLPIIKPPYGSLTAVDLTSGQFRWQIPLGVGPKKDFGPALDGTAWEGKNLGWPRRGHMLLTDEMIFVGQSGAFNIAGYSEKNNAVKFTIHENEDEQNLKAIEIESGKVLREIPLNVGPESRTLTGISGNAYGAPMTFLDGHRRQLIVVPVGGANLPAELVAIGIIN